MCVIPRILLPPLSMGCNYSCSPAPSPQDMASRWGRFSHCLLSRTAQMLLLPVSYHVGRCVTWNNTAACSSYSNYSMEGPFLLDHVLCVWWVTVYQQTAFTQRWEEVQQLLRSTWISPPLFCKTLHLLKLALKLGKWKLRTAASVSWNISKFWQKPIWCMFPSSGLPVQKSISPQRLPSAVQQCHC